MLDLYKKSLTLCLKTPTNYKCPEPSNIFYAFRNAQTTYAVINPVQSVAKLFSTDHLLDQLTMTYLNTAIKYNLKLFSTIKHYKNKQRQLTYFILIVENARI